MIARWQALALLIVLAVPANARAADEGAYQFALGQLLIAEGELEEALEAFTIAAERAPDEPAVRIERAELLFRLGRLELAAAEAAEAQRLAPEEPEALRLRGRIEMVRAERDPAALAAALEAFGRLVEIDAGDVEALASLGQLRLAAGQADLAIGPLSEAVRLRPGQPTLESLLARALSAAGRGGEAEAHQRALLAAHPRQLAQRLDLADSLARQGRSAEAVDLLQSTPDDQREMLEVRRRLAHQLYLTGDLDGARGEAERLAADDPTFAGARVLLGLVELATGNFTAAAGWLEPLALQSPQNEQIGDLYLRALEPLGRLDEALELLGRREEAMRSAGRAGDAERARLERALVLARAERWQELAQLAEALRAEQDERLSEQGTLLLAESLAARGEEQGALDLLGEADARRPALLARRIDLLLDAGRQQEAEAELARLRAESEGGDLRAAELLQRRGEFARSAPILEAILAREPDSVPVGYRLASAYERIGRVPEAVALLERVLERAPDFAPALNYLGYLWIERGENLERAVEMVRKAVRIDPDNGAYVDSLGWGYFRLGRFPEAVALLERAARLVPGDPTVLEHLGDALAAAGERERARAAYRRAIDAGAPAEALAERLDRVGGDS